MAGYFYHISSITQSNQIKMTRTLYLHESNTVILPYDSGSSLFPEHLLVLTESKPHIRLTWTSGRQLTDIPSAAAMSPGQCLQKLCIESAWLVPMAFHLQWPFAPPSPSLFISFLDILCFPTIIKFLPLASFPQATSAPTRI
jgi:hypothetical protein